MATFTLTFEPAELPAAVRKAAGLADSDVPQTLSVEVSKIIDGRRSVTVNLGYKTFRLSLPQSMDTLREGKRFVIAQLTQHWKNGLMRQRYAARRAG